MGKRESQFDIQHSQRFFGARIQAVKHIFDSSVQFTSIARSCPTLHDPMNCSTPGLPVRGLTQTHAHRIADAIQPSHSLSSPSPHAFNLSQHQDLFQWVGSSYQVAKVLEFQLQHQSFQWIWLNHFPSWSCCTQFCIYRGRISSHSKNWYSWDPHFMVNT